MTLYSLARPQLCGESGKGARHRLGGFARIVGDVDHLVRIGIREQAATQLPT